MSSVCGELDEAKLQIERLRSDHHKKVEQFEALRKMYEEQAEKLQQAVAKVDKHSQELSELTGELTFMKDLCEEMKNDLKEKDINIEHLSARNYALWSDLRLKLQELEEEKKSRVNLLEESNVKCTNQENQLRAFSEEIASLKVLLESSQRKCLEAEEKAEAQNGDFEEKLKLKEEQYHYLEEVHEELRREYEETEKEWEKEKSALLDEINSLQKHHSSLLIKQENASENEKQMHRDFSGNNNARETASTSEVDKLAAELNGCRLELIDKDAKLGDARKELEICHSSLMHLMSLNEEITVMLLVTNSGISEAQMRLANDVSDEHASDLIKGTGRCKGMLEESSRCQIYLREQVLLMETESNVKFREVCEAPGNVGFGLDEKFDEVNEIELEMYIWRSIAERLKLNMEENFRTRRELEESLLSQTEFEDMIKQEKDCLLRQLEEKDGRIESLMDKNAQLERELEKVQLKCSNVLSSEPSEPFEMERNSLFRAVSENEKELAC
ncbi:hypothetical protein MLD38_005020 [Melastoma candidum]|uniref:Uncharacterized protein n=1 Tax=Melastoma candidum TaxID=119954 RepID=A0ACB9S8D8_9MYRT|nr:hypothetical protein MLD38_005020 [Melastoma candidum]